MAGETGGPGNQPPPGYGGPPPGYGGPGGPPPGHGGPPPGYGGPPPGYRNPPPGYGGPPPRRGMGVGAAIGIGCGVLALLTILAVVGLYFLGARQSREAVRTADNAMSGMTAGDSAGAANATALPAKGDAAANATAQPDAAEQGDEMTGKSEATDSGSRSEGRQ